MVTRQPDIIGEAASDSEIVDLMVGVLGFAQLSKEAVLGYENSLAFLRESVAVFDLRPANVVRTSEGLIVPIDCIPVRFGAVAASKMQAFTV